MTRGSRSKVCRPGCSKPTVGFLGLAPTSGHVLIDWDVEVGTCGEHMGPKGPSLLPNIVAHSSDTRFPGNLESILGLTGAISGVRSWES